MGLLRGALHTIYGNCKILSNFSYSPDSLSFSQMSQMRSIIFELMHTSRKFRWCVFQSEYISRYIGTIWQLWCHHQRSKKSLDCSLRDSAFHRLQAEWPYLPLLFVRSPASVTSPLVSTCDVLYHTNQTFSESSWHPLSTDPLTTHPRARTLWAKQGQGEQ